MMPVKATTGRKAKAATASQTDQILVPEIDEENIRIVESQDEVALI